MEIAQNSQKSIPDQELDQLRIDDQQQQNQNIKDGSNKIILQQAEPQKITHVDLPYKVLSGHWLTISRPQYKRTCGLSSLVSLWNFQFSKLGMGDKDPISIEQAMLKLNLIGNGSVQQNMRKKFKKTAELTQKLDGSNQPSTKKTDQSQKVQDAQIRSENLSLKQYINNVDFGCFTGNDTLLKWYRLLCRIYGGSGRSSIFYKTNSDRSVHKTEESARKALLQGLNSNGKTCFIYHAYDHYFCPVGYEFVPKDGYNSEGLFNTSEINQKDNQLYIMVGESSKNFPCLHTFKWSEIQLDLETYWPKFFNIRRRKQGVQFHKNKENQPSRTSSIDCIMAFEKIKD